MPILKKENTLVADTGSGDPQKKASTIGESAAQAAQAVGEAAGSAMQDIASKYSTSSGSGGSGGKRATATTPTWESVDPSKTVDYSGRDNAYNAYVQAMDTLQQASQDAPGYDNQYQPLIDSAYQAIVNRKGFQYDLNQDQLYQQYRDKYMAQARTSMMDTMGQASALNGGYGSSYGQRVGQQAYDATMQNLNDVVPELYAQAYSQYQDEGDRLQQNLDTLRDLEATDYNRYLDTYNQWANDRAYATDQADTAWNRYLTERSYADQQAANLTTEQSDNLSRLMTLVSLGYTPTSQEIADAGVTPEQFKYYYQSLAPTASSGGGGSSLTSAIKNLGLNLPTGTAGSTGGDSNFDVDAYNTLVEAYKNGEITAGEVNSWLLTQPGYTDTSDYDDLTIRTKSGYSNGRRKS